MGWRVIQCKGRQSWDSDNETPTPCSHVAGQGAVETIVWQVHIKSCENVARSMPCRHMLFMKHLLLCTIRNDDGGGVNGQEYSDDVCEGRQHETKP